MRRAAFIILLTLFVFSSTEVFPFGGGGCGEGECRDCHSLEKKEAEDILKKWVNKVDSVEFSEVPGMWVVKVEENGQKYPIYLDFSKSYIITGNVIQVRSGENISKKLYYKFNRIDLSRIPLDDALILGNPGAVTKIIVFTDPKCPYCKQLHVEMKKIVQNSSDIAFYIKLYPLKMHPESYKISKSIICAKSMGMLEDSFADRPVPDPTCDTTVVDETLQLVKGLGINSTPTMVFPSGTMVPGFIKAEKILDLVKNDRVSKSDRKGK